MPIGIVPQWPLVVTAVMDQLPSYFPATAAGVETTIAEAENRANAQIRLSNMGTPIRVLQYFSVAMSPLKEAAEMQFSMASRSLHQMRYGSNAQYF